MCGPFGQVDAAADQAEVDRGQTPQHDLRQLDHASRHDEPSANRDDGRGLCPAIE